MVFAQDVIEGGSWDRDLDLEVSFIWYWRFRGEVVSGSR